ncbi:MAG: T9SS type A sorting domain-containing protein [Saprospiraceae bacterium]|nr:T9SS type A sorting domain-containing protein [Saprospiraceae bacterium]
MKHFTLLLLLFCSTFISVHLNAQLSILFVDDSADAYMNSTILTDGFDAAGISYTLFDAQTEGYSPDLATMSNYDLLVWHTSSWGQDLYLWNGIDQVNTDLAAYLSGGGNIWLIGNDFLYDVYGSPPVAFASGDFEYDYLGIESFDVESYTNDGNTGVPFVEPATGQPIPNLDNIDWIFSTLWYGDGVSPRLETVPVYSMGGSGYALEGTPCATWYDNGSSIALTYFFDLALASTTELAGSNIETVISFFESQIMTDAVEIAIPLANVEIAPVPASTYSQISFTLDTKTDLTISVYDLLGRQVEQLTNIQSFAAGQHSLDWIIPASLNAGLYFVQFQSPEGKSSHPIEIIR